MAYIRFFVFSFLVVLSRGALGQTERVQIEQFVIESEVLEEKREIYISKPLGYDNEQDSYFTIYVLDGESAIDSTKAIAELLYQSGYPKILIVAIPNTFRNRDLTPTPWTDAEDGGGSSKFRQFLSEELIPTVEENYRSHPYRILIGHSLGGLLATEVFVHSPALFQGMIAISPSVFYDDYLVYHQFKKAMAKPSADFPDFFFAMGYEPGAEGEGILKLHQLLSRRSPKNLNWQFEYYAKESHTSVPLVATLDGIRYLFRDFQMNSDLSSLSLTGVISHYQKLSEKFGKNILPPQRVLMNLGYTQWEAGDTELAIQTFEYYADIYPTMIIPFDVLSTWHEKLGDTEKAIIYVKRMLDIIPGFGHAAEKLKQLQTGK